MGRHCHLVAICGHCTGPEFCHLQLHLDGPQTGLGADLFHLHVTQLNEHALSSYYGPHIVLDAKSKEKSPDRSERSS